MVRRWDRTNCAVVAMSPTGVLLAVLQQSWRLQVALQLPSGATFISSTPEQLYVRRGRAVASEAVAGTRPRGPAGQHVAKDMCGHLLLPGYRRHTMS